jgi:hypothetical protein
MKRLKILLVLFVYLMIITSCAASKKPQKRKDCDCPKWSNNTIKLLNYDQGRV